MDAAQATYLPDTYRFSWHESGIEVIVDRLVESRGDLGCEMTVKSAAPFPDLLRQAKFNLSSTRTRSEWVKALSERNQEIDWYAVIEQVCTLSLRHWRDGAAFLDLKQVEPREDDAYLLRPYVVEGAASGVFADGGTGKSLFALGVALSIATGEDVVGAVPGRICPVLYLDWEWDEEAHAERLSALCTGRGIECPDGFMWYRREYASIIESAPGIRRFIAEHDIGFVVIDSLGFARGGEPESADATIKAFAAIRSLGVPALFVDHVAKTALDKTHSFGSVYTRNSARLMWRIDSEDGSETTDKRLGLVNTKWNRKFQRPRGLLLQVETDDLENMVSATFTDSDPPLRSIRSGGIKDVAEAVLRQNPDGLSLSDLRIILEAEGLKVTENVLGATMGKKRNKDVFYFMQGKWYLRTNELVGLANSDSRGYLT